MVTGWRELVESEILDKYYAAKLYVIADTSGDIRGDTLKLWQEVELYRLRLALPLPEPDARIIEYMWDAHEETPGTHQRCKKCEKCVWCDFGKPCRGGGKHE